MQKNKRAGGFFFSKTINVQTQIRLCREEFFLKINKRACMSIWHSRVCRLQLRLADFSQLICGVEGKHFCNTMCGTIRQPITCILTGSPRNLSENYPKDIWDKCDLCCFDQTTCDSIKHQFVFIKSHVS